MRDALRGSFGRVYVDFWAPRGVLAKKTKKFRDFLQFCQKKRQITKVFDTFYTNAGSFLVFLI